MLACILNQCYSQWCEYVYASEQRWVCVCVCVCMCACLRACVRVCVRTWMMKLWKNRMQFLAFLTFNVSTCIKRTNIHKSINIYDCFIHMCRAGFADGISNVPGIGDIWIISYWKLISLHVKQAWYGSGKSHCGDTENAIRLSVFHCSLRPVFWAIDGYIIKVCPVRI